MLGRRYALDVGDSLFGGVDKFDDMSGPGADFVERGLPVLVRLGKISAPHQIRQLSRVQETHHSWAGRAGSTAALDPGCVKSRLMV